MNLQISHTTRYSFDTPPAYGLQQLRLNPKTDTGQTVLDWTLEIEGAETQAIFDDEHGNTTRLVSIDPDSSELIINSHGLLKMTERGGVVGEQIGYAPLWLYRRPTDLTQSGPQIAALAETLPKTPAVSDFHDLSSRIASRVAYMPGMTLSTTSAEEAMFLKQGVCQDHAHIFIAAARRAGHPARYISGYLMMNDRVDQDATHAWAEVWLLGLGWTGFDVSNGISPDTRYVRLANGLDYRQAAPISGLTIGGSGESMNVNVQVQQQ